MKPAQMLAFALIYPAWFAFVLFVGAHLWFDYEMSASKQQTCKALSDAVGITISAADYAKSGCS